MNKSSKLSIIPVMLCFFAMGFVDLVGIAYRNGWITADKLRALAEPMLRNQYGQYLLKLLDEK